MTDTKVLAPGTFCWCEVGTANARVATKFYGDLFGWTAREMPAGDAGAYTMLEIDGRNLGGLYELSRDMLDRGVPPHWLAYVKVAKVDDAAQKATELGGRVVMGPFDVMTAGRMAVVQDPTGGTFAMWEPHEHAGAAAMGEIGTPCWYELTSTDKAEAGAFYAALFSWTLETFLGAMDYTIFKNGELSVGGLMQCPEGADAVPSHWTIYFSVEDCDATVAKAERLGGKVVAPAMDVPTVGRMAFLADPGGAIFAVIRLTSA
ncbi:MAG: VOC family protein [bacterium]